MPFIAIITTPVAPPLLKQMHSSFLKRTFGRQQMAQLPTLAPRPTAEAAVIPEKHVSKEHTEEEWECKRAVINQLYITENKKLVETMAILSSKHGFAATEQMYKKRFKKWNIRKRSCRKTPSTSAASTPTPVADGPKTPALASPPTTLPLNPACTTVLRTRKLPSDEGLELVLDSVRSWSTAKLEAPNVNLDPMVRYLANPNHPPMQDSRTMYRTFELVFDLWFHGKGQLAGLAARRAFYMLEYVLTEDHPDLVWHILDTIYDMVDRGHIQLLGMFLAHASELAKRQMQRHHPLVRILQQLLKCDYQTKEGREHVCHILRTAWLRNVDTLIESTGFLTPKDLWVYEQLIWDGRTGLRKGCNLATKQVTVSTALAILRQQHRELRTDVAHELDLLRIMALMLEYTQMDLRDRKKAEELALELLNYTKQQDTESSRFRARFHAYARKMLARLQEHRRDWVQAEQNLRLAVERREAAHGNGTDLRVIRDMWVLAAHCQRAGQVNNASQITQDAISRAEIYLGGPVTE